MTEQLVDRLGSWKKYKNYWTEDDDGTPYQDGTDGASANDQPFAGGIC